VAGLNGSLHPLATQTFEELKRRLTTTPVLALSTSQGAYIVETDASDTLVGCVLAHEQQDGT